MNNFFHLFPGTFHQNYADPEDVAYGILYLASDESKAVTGAELAIDNGMSSY